MQNDDNDDYEDGSQGGDDWDDGSDDNGGTLNLASLLGFIPWDDVGGICREAGIKDIIKASVLSLGFVVWNVLAACCCLYKDITTLDAHLLYWMVAAIAVVHWAFIPKIMHWFEAADYLLSVYKGTKSGGEERSKAENDSKANAKSQGGKPKGTSPMSHEEWKNFGGSGSNWPGKNGGGRGGQA
jgi:hypothetical protein